MSSAASLTTNEEEEMIIRPRYRRDMFQAVRVRISRVASVENQESQAQDELVGKFLDLLWEDCLQNPSHLVPFTAEMAQAADALLAI
jgi:head-tail adaptor